MRNKKEVQNSRSPRSHKIVPWASRGFPGQASETGRTWSRHEKRKPCEDFSLESCIDMLEDSFYCIDFQIPISQGVAV